MPQGIVPSIKSVVRRRRRRAVVDAPGPPPPASASTRTDVLTRDAVVVEGQR
jgi:hypothetical protein